MGTTTSHRFAIGDTVRAEAHQRVDEFDGRIVDLTTDQNGNHWAIVYDGGTHVPSRLDMLTLKAGSPSDDD